MNQERSIYVDNAATSWPKPPGVIEEMDRFYREIGAAAGRGTSARSMLAGRTIERCRAAIAALIHAPSEGHVVFCFNGTDALNMALRGCLRPRDHVVATCIEHNSVLRTLSGLKASEICFDVVDCDDRGRVNVDQIRKAIRRATRMVCVSHVSNVTGIAQPLVEIAQICRESGILFLVDGAQSLGHLPIDVQEIGCDFFASSGHKGLLGPLGTGLLYLSPAAAELIAPLRYGGTGTQSEDIFQPWQLPHRLEAGNLNAGGIFGLLAGVQFIQQKTLAAIHAHEQALSQQLVDGLSDCGTVKLYFPNESDRCGLLSLNIEGQDCRHVASILDSVFNIHVRAGLHCAPLIHKQIKSSEYHGTVRISPGLFNTSDEIAAVIGAIRQIALE
jgi:cysteine desulfurase family protein